MWAEDFGGFTESLKRKRKKQEPSKNKILKTSENLEPAEPGSVEDLVTHSRKIADVKKCLEQIVTSPEILLLTGPTGSAKTITLKVVARSLNIDIQEWVNPCDKIEYKQNVDWLETDSFDHFAYKEPKQLEKFEGFAFRCSRYQALFSSNQRRILLVEDFPNHFIWDPSTFFEFLTKYKSCAKCPIVFIVTDDDKINLGMKLFPNSVMEANNVINIKFNPVSNSGLMKILSKHADFINKESLKEIVNSCNGDVRTALSSLQFLKVDGRKRGTKPKQSGNKDLTIDFFQTLGRVLYPKKQEESSGKILVYDVFELASHIDNTALSVLHENFLSTFASFQDSVKACELFSECDLWTNKGDDVRYLSSVACVTGLMLANKTVKQHSFRAMSRSRYSGKPVSLIKESARPYPQLGMTERVLNLDVIPFLKHFPTHPGFLYQKDLNRLPTKLKSFPVGPIFKAPPPPRPIVVENDCDEEIVIEEFDD